MSTLELWVYEEADTLGEEANVYVHHELMLPAFPLCLAWLDCPIVRQHGRCAYMCMYVPYCRVSNARFENTQSVNPNTRGQRN